MSKKYSSKRVVKFMLGLWQLSPRACLTMVITQITIAVMTTTIAPVFVSQLLTKIANGSATMNSSVALLIGYTLILFIGDVVIFRISIAAAYISESKMQANIAAKVLEHLTAKSLGYHSNRMSGGIVSDNSKLTGAIERFWDTLIFNAVPIVTTVISVCVAMSFIFWQYAIVLAILSAIIIIVIIKSQTTAAPVSRLAAEKSSASTAYFADVISNISAVKAFASEEQELKAYRKKLGDWRNANLREMKTVLLITGTFSTLMMFLNIAAFIAAIFATEYHIASIGTVYLAISYTMNVVNQLWSVSSTTRSYIRVIGDAGPMIDALDEPIEISNPSRPITAKIKSGKIEFKSVNFTHDHNKHALFDNFSLLLKPGERIGLVGKSGSGKTSLTRLLLRFSDIDSGQILIDSQDISKLRQVDLRRAIAYVPQEPVLFHRSLRENIAYGRPGASLEEITEAARQANAMDFIDTLPDKFETIVGERGVKLSGGQRQRVAIARAILKNAPILVLDEATSALDSENEHLIQDALSKLMTNRTSIVIAHRLSTIAKLDRIVVMENGKIVEQGTHQDLLTNNGIYAKLWQHQSGGFIK